MHQAIKDGAGSGASYTLEQQQLLELSQARGQSDLFKYSFSDKVADSFAKRDKYISKGLGAGKVLGGAAGTLTSGAGVVIGAPTVGGSALAAVGLVASYQLIDSGVQDLLGDYVYAEGATVERSFEVPTASYASGKAPKVAIDLLGIGLSSLGSGAAFSAAKGALRVPFAPAANGVRAALKTDSSVVQGGAVIEHVPSAASNGVVQEVKKVGEVVKTKTVAPKPVGLSSANGANSPPVANIKPTHYKYYPTQVEWTAPVGTKQTYKVYQRDDINWDQIRINPKGDYRFIGKTNQEAALAGKAPELPDRTILQLHHIGQDSRGPLVEINSIVHKKGHKPLHNQFNGNKHPEFPVYHDYKWQLDVKEYWKQRGKDGKK